MLFNNTITLVGMLSTLDTINAMSLQLLWQVKVIAPKPLGYHILSLGNSCCHRNNFQFVQSHTSSDTQWLELVGWQHSLCPNPTSSFQRKIFVSALCLFDLFTALHRKRIYQVCLMPASFSLNFTQIRKPQTFPLYRRYLNLSKYVQVIFGF